MSYSPLTFSTYRTTNHSSVRISAGKVLSRRFCKSARLTAHTLLLLLATVLALPCFAQDWIRTGTGLGVEKVRLAASDFKPSSPDPKNAELLKAFNDTLWNDLDNAGIFEMVSKRYAS